MPFRQTLTKVRVVTRDKTFEYNTLKEAKEVFSELEIYRGSKNFTSAMQDEDFLRFESWEMYNAFQDD